MRKRIFIAVICGIALLVAGMVLLIHGLGEPKAIWLLNDGGVLDLRQEPDGAEVAAPAYLFEAELSCFEVDVLSVTFEAPFPWRLLADGEMKLYQDTGQQRRTDSGTWTRFQQIKAERILVNH